MKNGMKQIGPGVFSLPSSVKEYLPGHASIIGLDEIEGTFGDHQKEKVATYLLGFTKRHGWCAVEFNQLVDEMQKHDHSKHSYSPFVRALEQMVKEGLVMVVLKHDFWLSFLNILSPKIICPTPALVKKILMHQVGVARHAR